MRIPTRKTKYSIEDCYKWAAKRNGKCLSNVYSPDKLKWKCHDGHTWESTPSHIKRGGWCPFCHGSINEEKCRFIFQFLFGKKFPSDRKLLNGLEIDGYCKSLKLAFEYNGVHHYQRVKYWYAPEGFKKLQNRDKHKSDLCKKLGISKIDIPYYEGPNEDDLEKYIRKELSKLNISCRETKINWNKFIGIKSKLENIKSMAMKRDIKCISSFYTSHHAKLEFQCGKCNYIWKCRVGHFKNGSGCPKCDGKRYTIEDMYKLAALKGGKCLSKKYINETIHLEWECACGNVWKTSPHSVKHGRWCPKCGRKQVWLTRRKRQLEKA